MEYKIAAVLLIIWNMVVFFTYGLDKRRSRQGAWRISEKTLILMAIFMGGAGAILGMKLFRHKTKHLKFKIAVPFAFVLNIGLIALWAYYSGGI